jgi:hypothetical protein
LIGGGILRYGIGLIMRTTLVVGMFFYSLLDQEKNKNVRILVEIILLLIAFM